MCNWIKGYLFTQVSLPVGSEGIFLCQSKLIILEIDIQLEKNPLVIEEFKLSLYTYSNNPLYCFKIQNINITLNQL